MSHRAEPVQPGRPSPPMLHPSTSQPTRPQAAASMLQPSSSQPTRPQRATSSMLHPSTSQPTRPQPAASILQPSTRPGYQHSSMLQPQQNLQQNGDLLLGLFGGMSLKQLPSLSAQRSPQAAASDGTNRSMSHPMVPDVQQNSAAGWSTGIQVTSLSQPGMGIGMGQSWNSNLTSMQGHSSSGGTGGMSGSGVYGGMGYGNVSASVSDSGTGWSQGLHSGMGQTGGGVGRK